MSFPVSISTTTNLPFYNPTTQSQPLILHINSIYLITPPPYPYTYSTSSSKKPWMIMVRELKPGETHLYHPLSAKQAHFNLNEFRASKKLLVQGYRLENSKGVLKVLICSSSTSSPLEILVLYSNGILGKLTVTMKETSLQEFKVNLLGIKYLDDITKHKDMFIAVDRKGVLYKLDIEAMDVERRLVSTPPFSSNNCDYSFKRKRLVVDENDSSGELHLVARKRTNADVELMVYRFNETLKQWDVVQHLGCNRVLFVGVDHCFFEKTEDFPGCMGNCIVFGANCFPNYFVTVTDEHLFGNSKNNCDTQVGVYEMGMAHNFNLLSSAYPDFFKMIWPPPTWIFRTSKHIGNEEPVLILSSVKLIYPPKLRCGVPWIVSSVEIKGETRLFDPLTGDALPNIPEPVFLHQFSLHYLAEHYHIASINDNGFPKSLFRHHKVLVCSLSGDQSLPLMVEDCYLLVLSNAGQLSASNPAFVQTDRFNISYGFVDKFDDISLFKGVVYAIDRLGKLYKMSPDSFGELQIVIDKPIVKSHCPINMWRKRLVGSPWDEELYMIIRRDANDILDVYKLYDHINNKSWIKVHAFVDDQVLVLCRVYGFFVPATEFLNCPPLQNCVLFKDAFTLRLNAGKRPTKRLKGESEIQVFWLEEDKQKFKPISSYPGFPAFNLFSPPKWVMQSYCESEYEEDELTEVIEPSPVLTKNEVCNANSNPMLPPYIGRESCSPTVKFEGVYIKTELMPILQNISEKHGSLIGENTVRSNDLRACALESVAKLVMTLHNTEGKSLSDSQTSEIRFILNDLKCTGLKVDWLDQVVEKVMKLQENKPIIESILTLDKEIAKVEEEKRTFLTYSASKIQNLEEEKAALSAKISFPIERLDLDDCLFGKWQRANDS